MKARIVIVGAGLAGVNAAIEAAKAGLEVDLVCRFIGGRSASACAQGGINAALNGYDDGDNPVQHFRDTIRAGGELADHSLVMELCKNAPRIIERLEGFGVPFNRERDGRVAQRYFGGSKKRRTCFVGSSTGQALMTACENALRRYEVDGSVRRHENYELASAILNNAGECEGIVAQHVVTGEMRAFPAQAVIIATGGASMIYGKSTNPLYSNGSAVGGLFRQGADIANAEFVQFHPTAMIDGEKTRLISESVRGEGGRVFTTREGKPWYFLEEMFPEWGNLVTRDKASQAIYYVCNELGLGDGSRYAVNLDIADIPEKVRKENLQSVLELYQKYAGVDPNAQPMKVFPSAHYFMGGLYVDARHMTTIPGLFAAGECDHLYHGANRLGANSLLSAIHSGIRTGEYAANYAESARRTDEQCAQAEVRRQQEDFAALLKLDGGANPYRMQDAFSTMMRENVFIVRYNEILEYTDIVLQRTIGRLPTLSAFGSIDTAMAIRQFRNMLHYARVVTLSALKRDESRGAHYKPDFPDRNDALYQKATVAHCEKDGPAIRFEPIDMSLAEVLADA